MANDPLVDQVLAECATDNERLEKIVGQLVSTVMAAKLGKLAGAAAETMGELNLRLQADDRPDPRILLMTALASFKQKMDE